MQELEAGEPAPHDEAKPAPVNIEVHPQEASEDAAASDHETSPQEALKSQIDLAAMPVRMLPITSEELEHTEDKRLDEMYELHLRRAGDNLLPIKGAADMLSEFFGGAFETTVEPEYEEQVSASADMRRVSNKAVEIALDMRSEEEELNEMPVLPEKPTDEDLLKFAENHPSVRKVLKLFRGKVVGVQEKKK